ncbi:pollen-specific leucine-rich repeat extensin-like protein 1 [Musa acuminata AAA Group]|uniref:pollen-specific leucine-rich repeat extensin-like protein 1 n=1 Tax=Musa acuminata AAA Group TaxID=214697 RepID=UPI0031D7F774
MASGGSAGRAGASSSRSFDFGSDDVLCSYDDYAAQDISIGKRSDPPGRDLHESRIGRPLVNIYEQEDYSREDIISAVEKCMKKYADNLLRSLDGISGRLSQLEIFCYKLERSLGELRADFLQDQSEKDLKFKSLEKHLQEVHRSVQILRDKQELAETQKELAKLQLVQKESVEKNENAVARSVLDTKKLDDKPDIANQQLALVLPHQTSAPAVLPAGTSQPIQPYKELPVQHQVPVSPDIQQDQILMNQAGKYHLRHQTLPQDQCSQPMQYELHYVQARPQFQNNPIQAPPQQPLIANQNQPPSLPRQQLLPPQPGHPVPQQVVKLQQPASQAQIITQSPPSYPPYPSQPVNPVPETFPGSMPMQVPNPTVLQSGGIRPEVLPFGYGGTGSSVSQPPPLHNMQLPVVSQPPPLHNMQQQMQLPAVSQPPPLHNMQQQMQLPAVSQPPPLHNMQQQMQPPVSQNSIGPQFGKGGYMGSATYPPTPYNPQAYHPAYSYPPSNLPASRNQQGPPSNGPAPHYETRLMRNHPYGDMIEKAIGMGYDGNQVMSLVQRMAETGQPMDFNSLLDRLNGQAAGATPRPW